VSARSQGAGSFVQRVRASPPARPPDARHRRRPSLPSTSGGRLKAMLERALYSGEVTGERAMSLPEPIKTLWDALETARAEVLHEVEGVSQKQADWRPSERDWSVGEIVNHLTVAEIATGKLTTKLTREAEAAGTLRPFPADFTAIAPLPPWPPGPMEAPSSVWPEHGKPIGELIETMKATRVRSRQSIEKVAAIDPRPLRFRHFALGELDLAQWWLLTVQHDRIHLAQIRQIKAAPGYPA
jgi:hypothetical protein